MRAFVSAVLFWGLVGQGQAQSTSDVLVGHWSGTDEYRKGNDAIKEHVDLVVSSPDKHGRITMTYTFPDEATKARRMVKFLRMAPEKETIWWWHDDEIEGSLKFKTTGLKSFASDGSGEFTAENCQLTTTSLQSGGRQDQKVCTRYRVHLQNSDFGYTVEVSNDGKVYSPLSRWAFQKIN